MDFLNRLPIGIQDFEKLREENCFFVDKTGLLYKLVHSGNGYFFCRPRYFGKTLFVSMLEAYFRGRRDLFEGLAIENMEKEWNSCEVIRIDFSSGLYSSDGSIEAALEFILEKYEEIYGKMPDSLSAHTTYGRRFERLIQKAYEKSGKPIAVLIDDYDKPVLDATFTDTEIHNMEVLREFYSVLRGNDFYLKFVFVTGISKFASVNIFNGTDQLKDISTYPAFSDLCGFSEIDVHRLLSTAKGLKSESRKKGKSGEKKSMDKESDEENVSEGQSVNASQVFSILDQWYGGYRFADDGDMLFNPYSIMNCLDFNSAEAFASNDIRHQFWIQTGQPNVLISMLKKRQYDIFNILYGIKVDREELMEYRWTEDDLLPLIYQSGYLTRTSDDENGFVMLAMPNAEIVEGMVKALLAEFTNIGSISKSSAEIEQMRYLLSTKNLAGFIVRFESALENVNFGSNPDYEYIGKLVFHIIANLVGKDVSSDTNSDVMFTVDSRDGSPIGYVFQLKVDKGLDLDEVKEDAFARIEERGFASRFEAQDIPCKKVVLIFNPKKIGVAGWTSK